MKNQAETTINVRVSVEVKRPTCEILCHKLRPKKTVKLGKINFFPTPRPYHFSSIYRKQTIIFIWPCFQVAANNGHLTIIFKVLVFLLLISSGASRFNTPFQVRLLLLLLVLEIIVTYPQQKRTETNSSMFGALKHK
jgi:hypothetical protein